MERIGIMIDALHVGLRRAAQRHGVSTHTLSSWFRQLGGYRAVQQECNIRQIVTESVWRTKLFQRGIEALDKAHGDTILGLIVKVLEADAKRPIEREAPAVSVTVSQQQIQAQQQSSDDERYARLIARAAHILEQYWPRRDSAAEAGAATPTDPPAS
jgi:transposase-like protein